MQFSGLAELDRTSWPEIREQILRFEQEPWEARAYPGYPRWELPKKKPRLWPGLERVLCWRRSFRDLSGKVPGPKVLGRMLAFSHGVQGNQGQGPVPSAGGLQALELYLVPWEGDWLPEGVYHYDRSGHALAQLSKQAKREQWQEWVPSLPLVQGGALLWIIVGDGARVEKKYGSRGLRFLLLEAGPRCRWGDFLKKTLRRR
jgi:hypothetical protein